MIAECVLSEKIDEKINNKINNNITYVRNDIDEQFETFWKAYPRHTNTSKKETKNCFIRALRKTDLDTILSAIELQKMSEQWKKNGTKYIPMPTTWLNGEHWDDEVEIKTETVYSHDENCYKAAKFFASEMRKKLPSLPEYREETLQEWAGIFKQMETYNGYDKNETANLIRFSINDQTWGNYISEPRNLQSNYVKILQAFKGRK